LPHDLLAKLGIPIPIICTPEELLGDNTESDWFSNRRNTSDSRGNLRTVRWQHRSNCRGCSASSGCIGPSGVETRDAW